MSKLINKFLFLSPLGVLGCPCGRKVRIGGIILIFLFFSFSQNAFGYNCSLGGNISDSINDCLKEAGSDGKGAKLVSTNKANLKISDGLKTQINDWTMNVATFLSIFAVGAIVFGAFKMVISGGEEENINKGKDIVKWSMVGFLLVVSASAFVRLITEIMYSLD